MPHCSRCHGWISALVYECPACGEKPKSPPPRGIIALDVDEAKRDELAVPAGPPVEETPSPYARAPGPTEDAPPAITERPVRPAVAPRPPTPRPAAPPKPTPTPRPTPRPAAPLTFESDIAPVLPTNEDLEDEDLEDDVVEVVRKRPEEDLPDMDTPVG